MQRLSRLNPELYYMVDTSPITGWDVIMRMKVPYEFVVRTQLSKPEADKLAIQLNAGARDV